MGGLRNPLRGIAATGRTSSPEKLEAPPAFKWTRPWTFHPGKDDGTECPHITDAEGHDLADFFSSSETITPLGRARQLFNCRLASTAPELDTLLRRAVDLLFEDVRPEAMRLKHEADRLLLFIDEGKDLR